MANKVQHVDKEHDNLTSDHLLSLNIGLRGEIKRLKVEKIQIYSQMTKCPSCKMCKKHLKRLKQELQQKTDTFEGKDTKTVETQADNIVYQQGLIAQTNDVNNSYTSELDPEKNYKLDNCSQQCVCTLENKKAMGIEGAESQKLKTELESKERLIQSLRQELEKHKINCGLKEDAKQKLQQRERIHDQIKQADDQFIGTVNDTNR